MPNLDQLLQLISSISWLLFTVFAVAVFIRTFMRQGPVMAILQLLSVRVLVPLLLVIGISFISAALIFVPPTNVGVVISLISPSGVRPQPLYSGLHLIVPVLEKEVQYPTYWQTYTMSNKIGEGANEGDDSIRARTSDGQEVRLDNSVIFRIDRAQAVKVHVDWQDRYIKDFVRPVVRGFVRTQVSQFTVQEVNSSSRKDLEATLDRLLRQEFASKGIIMDQFLVRDITFTDEYAKSIEDKQVAFEGIERTGHQADQIRNLAAGERDRLETEAFGRKEKFIIEAQGRAQAIELEAEAQAKALKMIADALNGNNELLTYEYINKLSPNIRAMLVPNDAPLILPLQDMVSDLNVGSSITETTTTTDSMSIQSGAGTTISGPNNNDQ